MDEFERYANGGLGDLLGYMGAYVEPPQVMNQGLAAGETVSANEAAARRGLVIPPAPRAAPAPARAPAAAPSRIIQMETQQITGQAPRAAVARPTAAPKSGMSQVSVANVQAILRRIGYKTQAISDGLWGPTTARYWQESTARRKLDPTIGRAAPNSAWVVPSTYTFMLTAKSIPTGGAPAAPVVAPVVVPTVPPLAPTGPALGPTGPTQGAGPAVGLARVSVASVQSILRRIGYKKTKISDGLWGPTTAQYWKEATLRRGLVPAIQRGGPKIALVDPGTFKTMQSAQSVPVQPAKPSKQKKAGKKAKAPVIAPKVVPPSADDPAKSGMTKANVGQLQDILIKLGQKAALGKKGRDGLWGPSTAGAWKSSAERRKLDGSISRAGPTEAWVVPVTFKRLASEVGAPEAEPKGRPISAKTEDKKDLPKPGGPTLSNLVEVPLAAVNEIRVTFGVAAPTNSADILAMWATLARRFKLDPNAAIQGSKFMAVQKTFQKLSDKAQLFRNAASLVQQSTVAVPVKALQEGMKFVNGLATHPNKGRFTKVKVTGKWDSTTESSFFLFFNIPAGLIQTWELAFKNLVSSDKKFMRLPAEFAQQVGAAAQNFKAFKKAVAKKEKAAEKGKEAAQEQLDEIEKYTAKRLALATVEIPVADLQQALNEAIKLQRAGKMPGFAKLVDTKISGVWSKATESNYWTLFGMDFWGKSDIPEIALKKYINRVLSKRKTAALSGLHGLFGDLGATEGANFIRVPSNVANSVGVLLAAFNRSGAVEPPDEPTVAPPVKPKRQKRASATEPTLGPSLPGDPGDRPKQEIDVPHIEPADDTSQRLDLRPDFEPMPQPQPPGGQDFGPMPPGGQDFGPMPSEGDMPPDALPAEAGPSEPLAPKSSGGAGFMFAAVAGVGALLLLSKKKKGP